MARLIDDRSTDHQPVRDGTKIVEPFRAPALANRVRHGGRPRVHRENSHVEPRPRVGQQPCRWRPGRRCPSCCRRFRRTCGRICPRRPRISCPDPRAISREFVRQRDHHPDHVVGHGIYVRTRSVCDREVGRHNFWYGDQLVDARAGAVNPLELPGRQEGFSRRPSHEHVGIYNRIRLFGVVISRHKLQRRGMRPPTPR